MNFASLLKLHENREQPHYGNQYMVNCNRRMQNGHLILEHNTSGIKKKLHQPPCQRLDEIFESFQQNPNIQWIVQLETHRVKIHKFKPSKIKNVRAHEPQPIYEQQVHPSRGTPNPNLQHYSTSEASRQDQSGRRVRPQMQTQQKNYSPMNKMRPKTFGRQETWMQQMNQNKFSFGDDSEYRASQQQINQQQMNYVAYQNQNQYGHMQEPQSNAHQKSSYIEERAEYQVNEQHGINLMNQFQQQGELQYRQVQGHGQDQHKIQENQPVESLPLRPNDCKSPINQLANLQPQSTKRIVKNSQANPGSVIDFNLDVGFSFQEIDKINQDKPTVKPDECVTPQGNDEKQTAEKVTAVTNNTIQIGTQKKVISIQVTTTDKNIQPQQQQNSLAKPVSQTSILSQQQGKLPSNNQTPSNPQKALAPSQQNEQIPKTDSSRQRLQTQNEASPHRIYCKANIRNLTPEKFKYPRVDSRIGSEVKPFGNDTSSKRNLQEGKVNDENSGNGLQKKDDKEEIMIPCSNRLLALIDESKRLLESKSLGDENIDKIRRIVLHQPVQTKTEVIKLTDPNEKPVTQNKQPKPTKDLDQPKVPSTTTKQPLTSTPHKKQPQLPPFHTVTSPKSPIQQKPKFHNQLANIQTNYTTMENKATYNNTTQNKETSAAKPTVTYQKYGETLTTGYNVNVLQQYQQVSGYGAQQTMTNILPNNNVKALETAQTSYYQANYGYKPYGVAQQNNLNPSQNVPKAPLTQQKENISGYKPQILGYQPSIDVTSKQSPPTVYQYQSNNNPNSQPINPSNPSNLSNPSNPSNNNPLPPKTYSPYFPVTSNPSPKPIRTVPPQQQPKPTHPTYQTYTYSNFPSTTEKQPLTQNQNNYIRINTNYVSPLDKVQGNTTKKEEICTGNNADSRWQLKENVKPVKGLGIEGVKCCESKVYDPANNTSSGRILQADPKESSIQFSLRIEEHFHIGSK